MNNIKQRFTRLTKTDIFGNNSFWKLDGSSNGALFFPIRVTMIYLICSVLIYAFGPFDWVTYKPVLFYSLLIMYMAALWFGYRIGLMRTYKNAFVWKEEYIDKWMGLLSVLVVMNLFVYIINIFRDYGLASFDFPELIRQMLVGIKNPGVGYALRLERLANIQGWQVIGGSWFSLFNYLWAFVQYPIMIFSFIYFKRMRIFGKVCSVLNLICMGLFYLSIGTNIDILHIFLLLEIGPIIEGFSCWHKRELTKKKCLRLIASVMVGFVFVGVYFTWIMVSRGGINSYDQPGYSVSGVQLRDNATEKSTQPFTETTSEPATQDTTDVTTEETGEEITEVSTEVSTEIATEIPTEKISEVETEAPVEEPEQKETIFSKLYSLFMKFWISFASYFTQGYYGMSQALTLPWTPMCGTGSNMFVIDFITEHVYDIDQFTYQVKIEEVYGWGSDLRWHSMYTWLANDVSFYGVVVIMFLIGMLFAAMFKDAITTSNPFAKASIFYFILMMLFIPCNNQLGQRATTLLSFLLLVLCWFITKHAGGWIKKHFVKNEKSES